MYYSKTQSKFICPGPKLQSWIRTQTLKTYFLTLLFTMSESIETIESHVNTKYTAKVRFVLKQIAETWAFNFPLTITTVVYPEVYL